MIYYLFTLPLSGWELVAFMFAYIVAIVFAFTAHEFSHAAVAYWCGDPSAKAAGRFSLNPFKHMSGLGMLSFLFIGFGWAKPVPINPLHFKNYKRDTRLVSLSGITTNFIFAFIFSAIFFFTSPQMAESTNVFMMFLFYFLSLSISINLSLFFFNLLPIYPLDGFNFVASFMRPDNKFLQFMYRYGTMILLLIVILPVFDILYYYVVGGIQKLFFMLWGLAL